MVNPLIGTNNFKGNSEWSGTAPLVSASIWNDKFHTTDKRKSYR